MPSAAEKILVVDDEAGICRLLQAVLGDAGYRVTTYQRPEEALLALERESFDLVISDVRMPKVSGVDVLKAVKNRASATPVILITAFGTTRAAVEAMRLGTSDYITKPFKNEDIRLAVESVLERRRLACENQRLRQELYARDGFGSLIGISSRMREVFRLLAEAAESDAVLVIEGERGVGREAVARAVHLQSRRAAGPFVAIRCAALSSDLSEMAAAERGTLMLKDPHSMEDPAQARLLRFLQDRRIRRAGGADATLLDARVILAMRAEAAPLGSREAALRRCAAAIIRLPPLRERVEDVPLLAAYFLGLSAKRLGVERISLAPETWEVLKAYAWPGNVLELEKVLAQAAAATRSGPVGLDALPGELISAAASSESRAPETQSFREAKQAVVESFEKAYLARLLKVAEGNISRAASLADMDRKNFYDLLKKHDLYSRQDSCA